MKEKVMKYGVLIVVILVVAFSLLFSKTPVEQPIDDVSGVTTPKEDETFIYVDIKGEINNPGVYKMKSGMRVFQVIEMAGGFTSDANNLKVNMSAVLKDQDVIIVPSIFDIEVEIPIDNPVTNPSDVLLDINRANLEQLQTLPGIGPSTAQKIIDYRTTSGYFDVIEDIMNVAGIGEATFNAIKDLIKV